MEKKLILKKVIIAAFIVFFAFSYIRQNLTMSRIQKEIDNKQLQLEEVKQKNDRLQEEAEKMNSGSKDYIEKLARERLGMIKPGEKVVNSEIIDKGSN